MSQPYGILDIFSKKNSFTINIFLYYQTEMLLTEPLASNESDLPSPDQLRYKILLKASFTSWVFIRFTVFFVLNCTLLQCTVDLEILTQVGWNF